MMAMRSFARITHVVGASACSPVSLCTHLRVTLLAVIRMLSASSDIGELSVGDAQNAVGDLRKSRAVRGNQHRSARSAPRTELRNDLSFRIRIHFAGGLVAKQDFRFCRQCDRKAG